MMKKVEIALLFLFGMMTHLGASFHIKDNDRFYPSRLLFTSLKHERDIVLFIAITSGKFHTHLRHAARQTWLQPCMQSSACEYKFFVDCPPVHMSANLTNEQLEFSDMVFRNECSLMNKHPDDIHYGNSPPTTENGNTTLYADRIFYKIDWKVCFMRWIVDHGYNRSYIAFVEDDSFTCTGNMLHQAVMLAELPAADRSLPFRTGSPMFDGFDDSSTFMSPEVAAAFASHYMEPGFNCSAIRDGDEDVRKKAQWLSWGNSWISSNCNWREALEQHLHVSINVPIVNCMYLTAHLNVTKEYGIVLASSTRLTPLGYPCQEQPIIFHHGKAGEILLRQTDQKLRHTCEYMLLIDKIKDPVTMHALWNYTRDATQYMNYTSFLRQDGLQGWHALLQEYGHLQHLCASTPLSANTSLYCKQRYLRSMSGSQSPRRIDLMRTFFSGLMPSKTTKV